MRDGDFILVAAVAAAAAAAAVVVLRAREPRVASPRALGVLAGVLLGTLLWWLTGAMVLWVVFLAVGGLIGFGIERRLASADDRRA